MHKLEDEETGLLYATNVACKLLDRRNGRCLDYKHRMALVADCVKLDPGNLDGLEWLPETCAYRLRAAGQPLPEWHYLISGSRETVHEAGQSTRGWTVSEDDAGELEYHVVDRRSEARWSRISAADRRSSDPQRAPLRLRFDERAGIKLTCPADQPPQGAGLGARPARLDRRPAGAGDAAGPFEPGARIPLEGDSADALGRGRAATRAVGRRAALRRAARSVRREDRGLPQASALSPLCPMTPSLAAARVSRAAVQFGDPATRSGSCSSSHPLQLAGCSSPPRVCGATSSPTKSPISSISTMGPNSRRWRRGCSARRGQAKAVLRRLGPRLRRIGRRR